MRVIPPIWLAETPPTPASHLESGARFDVAIVGGGFAGLSAGLHLLRARPGIRVVVLEAQRVGAGASGRTTGMIGPGVGQSLPALVRRLGADRARDTYLATIAAVESAVALLAREEIDCELHLGGQLMVATTAGGWRRLAALSRFQSELGLPADVLDDQGVQSRLHLRLPAGNGPAAMRIAPAGTLHPGKLVAGLAQRVRRLGGLIVEGARVASVGLGTPVELGLGDGRTLEADRVVVATAGQTADLGLMPGRVMPVHLQVLVTEPLGSSLGKLGWQGREGIIDARRVSRYFRLTSDDRLVFGGGAPRLLWGEPTSDRREDHALAGLERELLRMLPEGVPVRVEGGWTGVIGYVLDALPIIGPWSKNPRVIHAVGWCGHGIALSLASGAWIASMVLGESEGSDLPWFRSDAPAIPSAALRWAGFGAAVGGMALMDRVA